ncbi:MAG TPA: hypothetical protein VIH59_23540 [Candidatus Tectomicrobia bacterium]|jgi:hypothetical protein
MRKTILLMLVLVVSAASAQQLTIGGGVPTGTPSINGGITIGNSGTGATRPVDHGLPPLTVDSALLVKQRLEAYSAYQAQVAPRSSVLREAGLSAEHDAVEHTTPTSIGPVGPAYVARLLPRAPTSKEAVDPGLADVSRLVVRARLGRNPTAAEVQAELRAFDAQITQLNQSLANMRPQIAKEVKSTGVFPRALEAGVLGVAPTDPQAGSTQAQEGFRVLWQNLLSQ